MDSFALLKAYKSKTDAWEGWRKLAAEVTAAGFDDLVKKHQPHNRAGYRQISKCIALLSEAYQRALREPEKIVAVCPECGSDDIDEYMMLTGPMICRACGFRVEEKSDRPNPFHKTVK